MTGGGGGDKNDGETEGRTPFVKSLLGASVSSHSSEFWPTLPSREQKCYQNSDPGGDGYCVG